MKKAFAYLFSIVQLILACAFLYQLFKFDILPPDLFLIAGGVILLFSALTLFMAKAKRVKTSVFLISLIFIGILAYGNYSLYITDGLLENNLNKNIANAQPVEEYISVIVMADAEIESISDLNDYTLGIDTSFESDKMNYASDWILENYSVSYTELSYDRLDLLINDLYSGSIAAILMDSTRYSLCDDIQQDFHTETKEVAKLKVDYSEFYALTPTTAPTNTPTVSTEQPEGDITERPFIIYVSGIDTYGTIAAKSRSDTNILMAVDPIDKEILLITTPRDTYTPLYNVSGEAYDKLTHAGLYGPECCMGTLATLYNTDIDYYIRVNFSSVVDIVNALDGIDVYSAYSFNSANVWGYYFQKGMNHLYGDATLAFCRERYSFPDGDNQRGRNHIEVIKGIINKCTSPSILMNYSNLISSLNGSFETNISTDELTSLIKMQLDDGASWTFESMALENIGSTSTTCYSLYGPSLYVGLVDETSRQAIEDALIEFMK